MAEDLTAKALDGLGAVSPQAWDALLPDAHAGLSHAYLTAWEQVELDGLRSRPLVVGDREPVAAAPAYFYDLDLTKMASPRLAALRRVLTVRVYEIGCPTGLTTAFAHDDGIDPGTAADAILAEGLAEAKRGGARIVVVQDFAADPSGIGGALSRRGFAALPIMPTVWLDVPFASFDDYLGAMRSQYRRRARRALARSAHLEPQRLSDFSDLVPELARLSRRMFERANEVKREVLGERFFEAACARAALSVLALRRPDGALASFALLLDDRPCLRFLACGFEREAGEREAAYFRLLYEIVRTAIDDGFRRVDFGVTTLAPKLDTGGVPVPLVAWIRHPNPIVQRALAAVAHRLFAPTTVEARNVFKVPQPAPMPAGARERPALLQAA